ncbi:MAG: hypothetical protein RIQ89_1257 [Bacteroidota bacterium]|jgi:predicted DCC family thiol-disulfide oxidoreductase YuxK
MQNNCDEIKFVLIDGNCLQCSMLARAISRSKRLVGVTVLAQQQTQVAAAISLLSTKMPLPHTVYVITENKILHASKGIFLVAEAMGYPYKLIGIGRVLPLWFTDRCYYWWAQHRYRVLPKAKSCHFTPLTQQELTLLRTLLLEGYKES